MADDPGQVPVVSRRGDNHVRPKTAPVSEHGLGTVEPLKRGDKLQLPILQSSHEPCIDERRDVPFLGRALDTERRPRDAVLGQIPIDQPLGDEPGLVQDCVRKEVEHYGGVVEREPRRPLAREDARRRSH